MKLENLKKDYYAGKILKSEYIKKMHSIHQILFEYSQSIKETDIKKIEIKDDNVLMTTRENEIKMICDANDQRTIPLEILNFNFYEKQELNMVQRLMNDCSYFFDIGANIGWYSINIAKNFNNVKIFAFEPIPSTFAYLKKNVELNKIQNTILFNFGFSDIEDNLIFYYYPEGSVNASLMNLSKREDVKEIYCEVKTIDNFIQEEKLKIDFIKCDVEGAELFVFKGGLKTIGRDNPIIFTELLRKWSSKFKYHPNDVVKMLKNIGYKCFVIDDENLIEIPEINEDTIETNFLFLHQKNHSNHINDLVKKP